MKRTIDDIVGNKKIVEVLESLWSCISQSIPNGKINHPKYVVGSMATQKVRLLKLKGLGEITFPELKKKYPKHYADCVGYIQEGIDKYEFRI